MGNGKLLLPWLTEQATDCLAPQVISLSPAVVPGAMAAFLATYILYMIIPLTHILMVYTRPQVVSLSPAVIPAAMAADNLSMAAFLAILVAVPTGTGGSATATTTTTTTDTASGSSSGGSSGSSSGGSSSAIPQGGGSSSSSGAAGSPSSLQASATTGGSKPGGSQGQGGPGGVTAETVALTLAAVAASCAAGQWVAQGVGMPSLMLMFMAVAATALASVAAWVGRRSSSSGSSLFAGASQLGSAMMALFFTVIGASAGSVEALLRPEAPAMIAFLFVMVFVHWAVLVAVNAVVKLPLPAVLIGAALRSYDRCCACILLCTLACPHGRGCTLLCTQHSSVCSVFFIYRIWFTGS